MSIFDWNVDENIVIKFWSIYVCHILFFCPYFLMSKASHSSFSDLRDGDLVYIKSNVQELLQFRWLILAQSAWNSCREKLDHVTSVQDTTIQKNSGKIVSEIVVETGVDPGFLVHKVPKT